MLNGTLPAGLLLVGYPAGAKPRAQQRCVHRSNTAVDVRGTVRCRDEEWQEGGRSAGERSVRGTHRAEQSQKTKRSH